MPTLLKSKITDSSLRLIITLFLFFILSLLLLSGCADKQASVQISDTRLLLDTFCTITVHGDFGAEELENILDEAFALCAELEALFSITAPGSDVWRINHAGGEPVTVDNRTIEVICAGLEYGALSDGLFDITIGRVSRLWDFSETSAEQSVPDGIALSEALATVDYRRVVITGDTVRLENPDAWIDLGAIAKGYIAHLIAEFLSAQGVSGALIDLGGDVVAVGNRQDGSPWRIALRDPFGSAGEWLGVVEVSGASVLGSGTYERQFEVGGERYHHILSPFTGMPVDSDIVSAIVITETAVLGEGLSTIAVLLGSERAYGLFERVPDGLIGAVLVLEDGQRLEFGDIVIHNG